MLLGFEFVFIVVKKTRIKVQGKKNREKYTEN